MCANLDFFNHQQTIVCAIIGQDRARNLTSNNRPSWRNWLARQTVNLEAVSSILTEGGIQFEKFSFFFVFFSVLGGVSLLTVFHVLFFCVVHAISPFRVSMPLRDRQKMARSCLSSGSVLLQEGKKSTLRGYCWKFRFGICCAKVVRVREHRYCKATMYIILGQRCERDYVHGV